MHYRNVAIEIQRDRSWQNLPVNGVGGRKKESLVTETVLRATFFGIPVQDDSLLFELKAILEEFVAKRIGNNYPSRLNSNPNALGERFPIEITKDGPSLVLMMEDLSTEKEYCAQFDMIQAKTLYYILVRALQIYNF